MQTRAPGMGCSVRVFCACVIGGCSPLLQGEASEAFLWSRGLRAQTARVTGLSLALGFPLRDVTCCNSVLSVPLPTNKYRNKSTVAPVISDGIFQHLQWMPESPDSTDPYIYCFFQYIHPCDKV